MSSGPEPLAVVLERVMCDLRRRRRYEQVFALGPRPSFELLMEIHSGADLDSRLARYATVDPETIRALGGDQFPPTRVVE